MRDLGYRIWDLGYRMRDLGYRIRDMDEDRGWGMGLGLRFEEEGKCGQVASLTYASALIIDANIRFDLIMTRRLTTSIFLWLFSHFY